jgi:hypothetical protein
MAGGTPANLATLERYEREPGWFPLIAGSASPTRLLSFRGIGFIQDWFLHATIGRLENKVMAGGTPANPAALERYVLG